jgi:hypothetical protein
MGTLVHTRVRWAPWGGAKLPAWGAGLEEAGGRTTMGSTTVRSATAGASSGRRREPAQEVGPREADHRAGVEAEQLGGPAAGGGADVAGVEDQDTLVEGMEQSVEHVVGGEPGSVGHGCGASVLRTWQRGTFPAHFTRTSTMG